MIDGLHILTEARTLGEWSKHKGITFSNSKILTDTGEIVGQYKADYKGLKIKLQETQVPNKYKALIQGSIPKHLKGNNLYDLTMNEDIEAIQTMQDTYQIGNEPIRKLEIGVNIECDYSMKCLKSNFICKNHKRFNTIKSKTNGIEIDFTAYSLKVYDKGYQYKIKDKNIIRFEIVFHRNRILNKYGIVTLNDLKDRQKLKQLADLLYSEIASCMIIDNQTKFENQQDTTDYYQYTNVLKFWEQWESIDFKKRSKLKAKILKWQKKNDLGKTKKYILEKLSQKITDLLNDKVRIKEYETTTKKVPISQTTQSTEMGMITTTIKEQKTGMITTTTKKQAKKQKMGMITTTIEKDKRGMFTSVDKSGKHTQTGSKNSIVNSVRKWVSKLLGNGSINFVQKPTENKQEKNVRKNIEQTI